MIARMKIVLGGICTVGLLLSACQTPPADSEDSPKFISLVPYFTPTTPCADVDAAYEAEIENGTSPELDDLTAARRQCRLDSPDLNRGEAETHLSDTNLAYEVTGSTILTLYARTAGEAPRLCCSIQGSDIWTRIEDSDLFGAQFRLEDLNQTILSLMLLGDTEAKVDYRGPDAPEKPSFDGLDVENLAGQTFDHQLFSPELGETRKLAIYLPPGHTPEKDWPVLFFADGISVSYTARLIEPLIVAGDMAPVVIVGLLSGQGGIVEDRSDVPVKTDLRNADYLPRLDDGAPERFDQHMRFVTDTVIPWAETRFGAGRNDQRRGVTGKSSGGTFALYAGYLNPDLFDVAIPQSPGSGTLFEADPAPGNAAEFWISAGTLEIPFLKSARASSNALSDAGYNVHFRSYFAGHAPDQWDQGLADTLPIAFPPAR
ncbi:MAG: alpha/beta hydrolase-fold protein [Pseudomonadota bacterium]